MTAFPGDPLDPLDPVDPVENSRKHDFADIHNDFGTFARNLKFNFLQHPTFKEKGRFFREKLPPEAAEHSSTLLLKKRDVFFVKNCRRRQPSTAAPYF